MVQNKRGNRQSTEVHNTHWPSGHLIA